MVKRNLINDIKLYLDRREYIAIVGPRQAGKTTFLEILQDYIVENLDVSKNSIAVITFEDRKLLFQFENEPVDFVKSYIPQNNKKTFYLMIDEFQYSKEGGQKLKLIYDTVKNLKIIITGSSSLEIRTQIGKFMVGRILSFNIYPFSFSEYLSFKNPKLLKIYNEKNQILKSFFSGNIIHNFQNKQDAFSTEYLIIYEEYCIWGGYPAVALTSNQKIKLKILSEILNNYLLKDIHTLLDIVNDKNLLNLSKRLAVQTGNIIVYKNLSNVSGLDYRNLKKYLNIFNETYICSELSPYYKNKQKELVKNPKIYFLDTGFRNNLIDSMNTFINRTDTGALVENSVYIELLKNFHCENTNLNFWRTKAGAEVDFVISNNDGVIPLEVKYSSFNEPKLTKSFISFINSFKPKNGIILTKNYFGLTKFNTTNIIFFPIYYL